MDAANNVVEPFVEELVEFAHVVDHFNRMQAVVCDNRVTARYRTLGEAGSRSIDFVGVQHTSRQFAANAFFVSNPFTISDGIFDAKARHRVSVSAAGQSGAVLLLIAVVCQFIREPGAHNLRINLSDTGNGSRRIPDGCDLCVSLSRVQIRDFFGCTILDELLVCAVSGLQLLSRQESVLDTVILEQDAEPMLFADEVVREVFELLIQAAFADAGFEHGLVTEDGDVVDVLAVDAVDADGVKIFVNVKTNHDDALVPRATESAAVELGDCPVELT